jgi:hypothetical protein
MEKYMSLLYNLQPQVHNSILSEQDAINDLETNVVGGIKSKILLPFILALTNVDYE